MNNIYKYSLDRSSKKFICPNCGKKRYVRYVDKETGAYANEIYGKCDRADSCNYMQYPKDGVIITDTFTPIKPKETYFVNWDEVKNTLSNYDKNTFIVNLISNVNFPLPHKDIESVVKLYFLGTISKGYRRGFLTIPYIDINYNIRAVQLKQFNKNNSTIKTDNLTAYLKNILEKENKNIPDWLVDYQKNDTYFSCLFGEHLLNEYKENPVCLVEAPKTAIYCALYFGFPSVKENPIWLAVYNKSSFKYAKLKVLKGRDIYIFPDLAAFDEWSVKSKDIFSRLSMKNTSYYVSDLLNKKATEAEKKEGKDIADYIIKHDWRLYRNSMSITSEVNENNLGEVKGTKELNSVVCAEKNNSTRGRTRENQNDTRAHAKEKSNHYARACEEKKENSTRTHARKGAHVFDVDYYVDNPFLYKGKKDICPNTLLSVDDTIRIEMCYSFYNAIKHQRYLIKKNDPSIIDKTNKLINCYNILLKAKRKASLQYLKSFYILKSQLLQFIELN